MAHIRDALGSLTTATARYRRAVTLLGQVARMLDESAIEDEANTDAWGDLSSRAIRLRDDVYVVGAKLLPEEDRKEIEQEWNSWVS